MKIPIKFDKNFQLKVSVNISSPSYKIGIKPILFLIDTGSPKSFFSEGDALRLALPLNSMADQEVVTMVGSKYNLLKTKQFKFYFRTVGDKLHIIELNNFFITKTTKKTQEGKLESQNIPSILGTDFFVLNNLKLHFDPNKEDNYIEVSND